MTRRGRRRVDLLPLKVKGEGNTAFSFFSSPFFFFPSSGHDGFRSSNDAEKSFELQLPREGKDGGAERDVNY